MSNQNVDIFTQYLLDRFAPVALFLNKDLDVMYTHGDIERYFSFPRALIQFNVTRMLSDEIILLFKDGVRQCLQADNPVIYEDIKFKKQREVTLADLRFQPLNLPKTNEDLVLVEIVPKGKKIILEDDAIRPDYEKRGWKEQIEDLERQLKEARQETQNLISEQEATHEELHASNRELMSSNEELQSTNEELQSVNEELYTVNSELQLKNEALTLVNNDVLNLLKSTEIGTIFLDKEFKIRRFTPAIQKHFKLMDIDIGRSITDFSNSLVNVDISKISQQVFHTLEKFEKEVVDVNGNHSLLRVLPYRTRDDLIQGLVITFVDVNELTKVREKMMTFAEKFKAIFQNAKDLILDLSANGLIKKASRGVGAFSVDALHGKKIFDLLPEKEAMKLRKAFGEMPRTFSSLSFSFDIEGSKGEILYYKGILIPISEPQSPPSGRAVLTSFIGIIQDVSQEVKAQREVEQSLEEYQAFMDNARHQIALVDQQGVIKYINYTQHTGVNKGNMIGSQIFNYLLPSEQAKVKQSLDNIFSGNPFDTVKFKFKDKIGKESLVELVATPVILEEQIKYVALIGYNSSGL